MRFNGKGNSRTFIRNNKNNEKYNETGPNKINNYNKKKEQRRLAHTEHTI